MYLFFVIIPFFSYAFFLLFVIFLLGICNFIFRIVQPFGQLPAFEDGDLTLFGEFLFLSYSQERRLEIKET